LFTEKLVAVGFAFRQRGLLFGAQAIEFQTLLIQVIAVGDLPEQLGFTGFQTFGGEHERLVDRQKLRLCIKWIVPAWARLEISRANKRKK
jgi:hypothetical protein